MKVYVVIARLLAGDSEMNRVEFPVSLPSATGRLLYFTANYEFAVAVREALRITMGGMYLMQVAHFNSLAEASLWVGAHKPKAQ